MCGASRSIPEWWVSWVSLTGYSPRPRHRVHHGSETHYLDRNYGEVLMVWDHLFGTYTPEEEEPLMV